LMIERYVSLLDLSGFLAIASVFCSKLQARLLHVLRLHTWKCINSILELNGPVAHQEFMIG
jgi:hypothetical protein